MTRREPFDSLDSIVQDAAAALADDLNREVRGLMPDFAAIVEEAHARDPSRVTAAALAEARELAPVVDLRSDANLRLPRREQAEFMALLAEARADIDADVAKVRAAGPPPVPVPEVRRVRGRAWVWLAAAAVAALTLIGVRPLLSRGEATAEPGLQAPWQGQDRPPQYEVTPAPEPAQVIRREPEPEPEVEPTVGPEPAPVEAVAEVEEAEAVEEVEETGPKEPVAKARSKPAAETQADRLRRLDAEAEALWQSGDLAGAEARYREIVALAPGARAADLAYGDLFSLARQRHGADEEAALWRAYLEAFPRGRYADDARAGLCRRAEGEERRACWQAYLDEFPAGVHRHQAARVLGEAETGG